MGRVCDSTEEQKKTNLLQGVRMKPKMAKMRLKIAKMKPKMVKMRAKMFKMRPKMVKMRPKMPKRRAKMTQKRPEMAKMRPKIATPWATNGFYVFWPTRANKSSFLPRVPQVP